MGYIRLKFKGLSDILGMDSQLSLIVLVDEEEKRQLVVTCDQNMRNQLKLRMEDRKAGEQLLPEVLSLVLGFDECLSWEVHIENMQEGRFITKLFNNTNGMMFDIRCSDAILWAFVSHCPILVKEELFANLGVPFSPEANQIALPVNVITDDMLEYGLKKAIDMEDYEAASKLRDELKRRHEKKN